MKRAANYHVWSDVRPPAPPAAAIPPSPVLRQIINDDVYRIREPADGQTDRQTASSRIFIPSFLPSIFSLYFTNIFLYKSTVSYRWLRQLQDAV